MALSTFSELKTSVQNWLDRSDYSAVANDMIVLAEGHFNLELHCREMLEVVDLTPSSGVCTLPADFLGAIRVVVKTSPRQVLKPIGYSIADQKHDVGVSGIPVSYSIVGDSLYTYPASTTDIELTYREKVPALSDSVTSNWLLAKYPNLYLSACMMEAHRYFNNTEGYSIEAQRVQNQIDRLNDNSMFEEYADAQKSSMDVSP